MIDSEATVRARLLPEIHRSIEGGVPVLMVVSDPIAGLVRADVGTHAPGIVWGDPAGFYTRLGAAFECFRRYLADRHAAGQPVHVVAEPEFADDVAMGTAVDRARAYLPYESVCNETYAPYGSPVTCVWDTRRHSAAIIEEARNVHGHELTEGGPVPYAGYRAPEDYLAGRAQLPPPQPPVVVDHDVGLHQLADLRALRAMIAGWTGRHGFRDAAAEDVGVAVTEIATNALVHGGSPARVRAWHDDGVLVVQVDDAGGRPVSPFAGYRRPEVTSKVGGRGLWLARQLADTVDVHSGPGVTSVRLRFPREIMHRDAG
ncbi:ATP-binding protein [Actinoplanes sp. CA-252034]|uniref:ATP-binding protein n=1 Tax=Actinoplanes sp. CA-252034 TaxID=3239906 RepID=UPI003D96E978